MQRDPFGHIKLNNKKPSVISTNIALAFSSKDLGKEINIFRDFSKGDTYNVEGALISDFNSGNLKKNPRAEEMSLYNDFQNFKGQINSSNFVFNAIRNEPLNLNLFFKHLSTSDLLMVSNDTFRENESLQSLSLPCPLMTCDLTNKKLPEEIIFLYDYDHASMNAIKKFLKIFKKTENKITVVMLNNFLKKSQVLREKVVVQYFLQSFNNVGVFVSDNENLSRDLSRLCCEYSDTLLIMGKRGADLIFSKDISSHLSNMKISYFLEY